MKKLLITLSVIFALVFSTHLARAESEADFALALMLKAQPRAPLIAWGATYETTAAAIAKAAAGNPLYAGMDGIRRTISVMVAVAFFESHFNPKAEGDCPEKDANGMCLPGSIPHSFCAFQIHESNFAALKITKEQILDNIDACAAAGIRMMKKSFDICKSWKPEERLNQYATGGGICVRPRHDEGEHRIRKAMWLYRWKIEEDKRANAK